MRRSDFLAVVLWTMTVGTAALAEPISVRHIQRPMHRFMVARSEDGKTIASGEFSQVVQGNEVTMRLTYRFVDGSIDDEATTYTQQGTFRLVRNHHIEKGPFFTKPIDFTVEAATGIVTNSTIDKNGKIHVESKHMRLPDDLANGIVGTLSGGDAGASWRRAVDSAPDLTGGRTDGLLSRTDLQGGSVSHSSGVGWHREADCAAART
jgi:hypothetical protein